MGKSEIDQLFKIFEFFGQPNSEECPTLTKLPYYKSNLFPKFCGIDQRKRFKLIEDDAYDLLMKMLVLEPKNRISCHSALKLAYFDQLDKSFLSDGQINFAKKYDNEW